MSTIWSGDLGDDPSAPPIDVDALDAVDALAARPARGVDEADPPVRLGRAALAALPRDVKVPLYDVDALRTGILHLGCGAFHRAHQALLTQRAIEAEMSGDRTATPAPWGIVAASLRSPTVARALQRQDGLYTVLERGPERTRAEVVGTIRRTIFAPQAAPVLDQAFTSHEVRIVTLTVTSAGYCVDPSSGRLEAGCSEIQHDLRADVPRSAIGLLAKGLGQRRVSGGPPPVVLSCDNMLANGRVLQQACVDYASLHDDGLAAWIDSEVQFPATMVDRIVPTSTDADRQFALRTLGLKDDAPVSAEPFSQWVIERFDGPRPRWDAAGAEYVGDVAPWEASKLRLLNGGHLAVAYLGLLARVSTVHEALGEDGFHDFALRFMIAEQKPTLPASDHDIDAYAHQLLDRWCNHGIVHQLQRVGRDGSGKLPTRLLASLKDNLVAGRPAPCTLLAVAAWMLCATEDDENGDVMIEDEHGDLLRSMRVAAGDNAERWVDAALLSTPVFGPQLAGDAGVRAALARSINALQGLGPIGAMKACLDGIDH